MSNGVNDEKLAGTTKIVYILYLVNILLGVTGIIGVIMAYVNRGDAPDWLKSHYQFQIRTFWIGCLYTVIGIILTYVLIGILVLLFVMVWWIIRSVNGMKYLDKNEPHPNPKSWLF